MAATDAADVECRALLQVRDLACRSSCESDIGEGRPGADVHRRRRNAFQLGAAVLSVALGFATLRAAVPGGLFQGSAGTRGVISAQLLAQPQDAEDAKEAGGPLAMTFYLYRAQGEDHYEFSNVNAADMPGVMWYLHNEVVGATPRKFSITRVLRYKVTVRNSDKLLRATKKQFGPFVAFDAARCTVPDCQHIWWEYGYSVGCQFLSSSIAAYHSPFETSVHGRQNDGLWYSLPGPCPSQVYQAKDADCRAQFPGGRCGSVDQLHQTGRTCTYVAEEAGEVRLDELAGIANYTHWWARDGCKEYDYNTDQGVCTSFWDGKHDPAACAARMDRLQELFRTKYPKLPVTFGEAPCDAERPTYYSPPPSSHRSDAGNASDA